MDPPQRRSNQDCKGGEEKEVIVEYGAVVDWHILRIVCGGEGFHHWVGTDRVFRKVHLRRVGDW
jgi:hypothetical protein